MIYLHRSNCLESIQNCYTNGWGAEVDIIYNNGIYLGHLPDITKNSFEDLLEWIKVYPIKLILDIKTQDLNLVPEFLDTLRKIDKLTEVYLIDTITPNTINFIELGLKVLLRYSIYEKNTLPKNLSSRGIWLDYHYLIDPNYIPKKEIFLVSPELHKLKLTEEYIQTVVNIENVCTDFPKIWEQYLLNTNK